MKKLLLLGIVLLMLIGLVSFTSAFKFDYLPNMGTDFTNGADCDANDYGIKPGPWYCCGTNYDQLCRCSLFTGKKWKVRECGSGKICATGFFDDLCILNICNTENPKCPEGHVCVGSTESIGTCEKYYGLSEAENERVCKDDESGCNNNNQLCECKEGKWVCNNCLSDKVCINDYCIDESNGEVGAVQEQKTVTMDLTSKSINNFKQEQVTIKLNCDSGTCQGISGKLSWGDSSTQISSSQYDVNLDKPRKDDGKKTYTFKFTPDDPSKFTEVIKDITIDESNLCSQENIVNHSAVSCSCGASTYFPTSGFCCYGKKFVNNKDNCGSNPNAQNLKQCPKQGYYINEDCYCYGIEVKYDSSKKQVCCQYSDANGDFVVKNSVDECPLPICSGPCNSPQDKDCRCQDYCNKKGNVVIKGETCKGFNTDNICQVQGGQCMIESSCTSLHKESSDKAVYQIIPDEAHKSCKQGEICCPLPGDGKRTILNFCDEICRDPDGCICPEICNSYDHFEKKILPGFTCLNKYHEEEGSRNVCNNKKKDDYCPPGCFWFNDLDCGVDKNLGNALWDVIIPKDWRKAYDETWGKFWYTLGAQFDIMTWAESVCNPISPTYKQNNDDTTIIGSGNLVGWLGARKDRYNLTHYSYAVHWFLSGLPENNTYVIKLKGNKEYIFPGDDLRINISRGETQSGDDFTFTLINNTEFNKVCIDFEEKFSVKPTLTSRKVDEICRSI